MDTGLHIELYEGNKIQSNRTSDSQVGICLRMIVAGIPGLQVGGDVCAIGGGVLLVRGIRHDGRFRHFQVQGELVDALNILEIPLRGIVLLILRPPSCPADGSIGRRDLVDSMVSFVDPGVSPVNREVPRRNREVPLV